MSNNTVRRGAAPSLQSAHGQGNLRNRTKKRIKSCVECRRRKIKCTFEPGRAAICIGCYARGSTCVDQEYGYTPSHTQHPEKSSHSLRERVTQLEDLVKQVLRRMPDSHNNGPATRSYQADAQASEVLKSLMLNISALTVSGTEEPIKLPDGLADTAPTLGLFDNHIIETEPSYPAISRSQYNKSKALIAALTQLLPAPHDLETILNSSTEWWTTFQNMFPDITDSRCLTLKEAVSHSLRSERPAEIGKILVCIAICIHKMPTDVDWKRVQPTESRPELMERYVSTVERLIIYDNEFSATMDGIECMILSARYHINMGRPRRAWLLNHRAIAFCELLGYHRSAAQPNKSGSKYGRQVMCWSHVIFGDRFLALILGLPYSVSEVFCAPYIPTPSNPMMPVLKNNGANLYVPRMLPIITKILNRNQSVGQEGYSTTLQIDQELEELHNSMDPAWWSVENSTSSSTEDYFDRLSAQFFHHYTRICLHMAFMLRSSSDKRYQYSHGAALDGARELIYCYRALRTNNSTGPYICKLFDFHAFTAAMLLLLNICGYSARQPGSLPESPAFEQDQNDLSLIHEIISMLYDASDEPGGAVSAQCAQTLEMLAQVKKGISNQELDKSTDGSVQVSIPYFGTMTIRLGKQFTFIRANSTIRSAGLQGVEAGVANQPTTYLPTPKSVTCNQNDQHPMSAAIDSVGLIGHSEYESTRFVTSGLGQPWSVDDSFVTFDSFMPLPAESMDLSSGMSAGSEQVPQRYADAPPLDPNIGSEFSFGNFSFAASSGNVDLDHGWHWFGVDGPSNKH